MLCNTLDDQVPYANDFLRIDLFVLVLKNCVAFVFPAEVNVKITANLNGGENFDG